MRRQATATRAQYRLPLGEAPHEVRVALLVCARLVDASRLARTCTAYRDVFALDVVWCERANERLPTGMAAFVRWGGAEHDCNSDNEWSAEEDDDESTAENDYQDGIPYAGRAMWWNGATPYARYRHLYVHGLRLPRLAPDYFDAGHVVVISGHTLRIVYRREGHAINLRQATWSLDSFRCIETTEWQIPPAATPHAYVMAHGVSACGKVALCVMMRTGDNGALGGGNVITAEAWAWNACGDTERWQLPPLHDVAATAVACTARAGVLSLYAHAVHVSDIADVNIDTVLREIVRTPVPPSVAAWMQPAQIHPRNITLQHECGSVPRLFFAGL